MIVITMDRKTLDKKPVVYSADENGEDYRDWWVKIETKEEEMVYDAWQTEPDKDKQSALKDLWDAMIVHAGQGQGVMWGEDDIYGYIRPDETMPDVGDEYTDADEDKWLRVE